MNYASQLKGWAVDRITEAAKVGIVSPKGLDELNSMSDQLAKDCYIPETDFNDTIQHLSDLLKQVPDPLEKVRGLIAELGLLEEDIERQLSTQVKLAKAN